MKLEIKNGLMGEYLLIDGKVSLLQLDTPEAREVVRRSNLHEELIETIQWVIDCTPMQLQADNLPNIKTYLRQQLAKATTNKQGEGIKD